jgi:hypothetical protein
MTDGLPTARVNLEPNDLPLTIEAISSATGEVVWRHVVTGPGAIFVPPLAKMIGCPVRIRFRWANGTVTES